MSARTRHVLIMFGCRRARAHAATRYGSARRGSDDADGGARGRANVALSMCVCLFVHLNACVHYLANGHGSVGARNTFDRKHRDAERRWVVRYSVIF